MNFIRKLLYPVLHRDGDFTSYIKAPMRKRNWALQFPTVGCDTLCSVTCGALLTTSTPSQESHAPLYGRQTCALVMYSYIFLLFPIVTNFLIHTHPSLTLPSPFADQVETSIIPRFSFLSHSQEYQ